MVELYNISYDWYVIAVSISISVLRSIYVLDPL